MEQSFLLNMVRMRVYSRVELLVVPRLRRVCSSGVGKPTSNCTSSSLECWSKPLSPCLNGLDGLTDYASFVTLELKRKAIEMAPNDFGPVAGLAVRLTEFGQEQRAIELFEHAMRLSPKHPWWVAAG